LRGANQLLNASAALAALEALREALPVSQQAVRTGLVTVDLIGRFQVLAGRPTIVYDVAHNPHAAAALANNLDQMGFHPYTYAVFGAMKDKDIGGILRAMGPRIDHWLLTPLDSPRSASADEIAALIAASPASLAEEGSVTQASNVAQAFDMALSRAGENDRIVVFGSFYTVAGVMLARALHRH
jgi:dihydrofolate synthase/folylpolyglutamate synthase